MGTHSFFSTHQARRMAWKVRLRPLLPHPPLLPCVVPLHPSLLPPLYPARPPVAAGRPRPSPCQRLNLPPLQLHLPLGRLEPESASASAGRKRTKKRTALTDYSLIRPHKKNMKGTGGLRSFDQKHERHFHMQMRRRHGYNALTASGISTA